MSYQFSENSAADIQSGSDWIKDLLTNHSVEAIIQTEKADFVYTPGIILTSTLWNQSGTIYVMKDNEQTALTGYTYNQYCPNISKLNSTKCVTGCSNTADSQILYYWMERGYTFDLTVTANDYYILGYDQKTYYASENPVNGEASISTINKLIDKSVQATSLQKGDFIAALNFYCGLKNHSTYASSTSTTSGTTNVYKAAGFDGYKTAWLNESNKTFTADGYLSDVAISIIQECINYGEVLRVGIEGHAIYIDGYRKDGTSGRLQFHVNYGWGVSSNSTTFYDAEDFGKTLKYMIYDLSPDISVKVTSKESRYFGGSFLRGLERINNIQNDKATSFTFVDEIKGATISLTAQATITSNVDVNFQNLNVSLLFDKSNGIYSKNAMSFEMNGGNIAVNYNNSAAKAVFLDGTETLTVTMNDSWVFSGYHKDGMEYVARVMTDIKDYSISAIDTEFLTTAVTGTAFKAGSANDSITITNESAIFGNIDLGGGKNSITVENGSLVYGGFTGTAGSLTVNMLINENGHYGPMIAVNSLSSDNSLLSISGGTIYVTLNADITDKTFALLAGFSVANLKKYSVELTVGKESYYLSSSNLSQDKYSLIYNNNMLSLSSNDQTAPIAPVAAADITEITNQNVTVSATFASDSAKNEYKIDNGAWQIYSAPGVLMLTNGVVYFRSTDAAGNVSSVTQYDVTNIDKVPPEAPVVAADIKTFTNKPVTLTATFDSDAVVNEYSINNGIWQTYPAEGVVITDNASVKFRSKDAAGNTSKDTVYVINYIDTVPPEAPTFAKDIDVPTQQNVTVTATFDKTAKENKYSLDNGTTWLDYTNPILCTENQTIIFRSFDEFGNYIESVCVVDNIDRVAPVAPVATADNTALTNKDVTLSVKFENANDKNEYSIDNGAWQICTGELVITQNGTIRFRSTDAAGNVSKISEYIVSNIDKTPPADPEYKLSTYNWTADSITVTCTFAADSVRNEYQINDGEWLIYNGAFAISDNAKISMRSTDASGNSGISVINVSNIDKNAPVVTISLSSSAKTTQPVTVTAEADDGIQSGIKSIEYSFDGKIWTSGKSVTVSKSGTVVYFQAIDNVGNVGMGSIIINNIIDQKPDCNISGNDLSQILAYDAANGKVGYVSVDTKQQSTWHGVWEWSPEEAAMWRVDGTGIFAGSKTNKDGILLYNGSNNTFAAWTDLGSGD